MTTKIVLKQIAVHAVVKDGSGVLLKLRAAISGMTMGREIARIVAGLAWRKTANIFRRAAMSEERYSGDDFDDRISEMQSDVTWEPLVSFLERLKDEPDTEVVETGVIRANGNQPK